MPLVLKDRVKETTTTISTGTYTLAGAVTGYQSFSVVGDGNTTYYTVTNGTDWEVGIGTYTASGTTLSRDTILASSNSGNAVSWGAGSKDVFLTYPAERSVYVDGAEIVPATSASYSGNVTTIQLRFSSTPGSVPTGASLSAGELVVNTADGKLYFKDSGGTVKVLSQADQIAPLTTKGDLLVNNGTSNVRLPVGTDNYVLTADSSTATGLAWAVGGGGISSADIQEFASAGTSTWTKPSGAKLVYVLVFGGGGGGGSGRRRATASISTTACFGGGGGGPGGRTDLFIDASLLGPTETVTVGSGGTGGAARTTDDTSGANGIAGDSSSFGSWVQARGGSGGAGGTGGAGGAGGNGGNNVVVYSTGTTQYTNTGGAGANGTGGAGSRGSIGAGGGGGGGGNAIGSTAQSSGGAGGLGGSINSSSTTTTGGGGTAGQLGGAGGAGGATTTYFFGGSGGGAGSSNSVGAAGAGGAGGFPGGGGGGGGAGGSSTNSGAGGNGADGYVIVITFF